jgi:REP element-mobilizing transposase RayT
MKGYDYSSNNLYFVTSCVQDRVCCFGRVAEGTARAGTARELSVHDANASAEMVLNEFGKIVNHQLQWLENQYPYVVLHHYIVMPNHIHAIIEIDALRISHDQPLQKIKSLSELMGAFKTTSSKLIHRAGYADFQWQRSFHDHIIRDERAYLNISNYIETNAERWKIDTFYNTL